MDQTENNDGKILSKNLFPVIGVGASAGGLEAFKKLVKAIPEKPGMAFILVQHLHPDHDSALPEILQRETSLPVSQISNNVEVQPDHIYIIPSNKMLVANDGILQLSPRPGKAQKNMPIDVFFTSLAEIHKSYAIGIVLSGTGVDGTLGLKNIKDQGGITFAQDIESAAYDAMPQNAVNAQVVDFILPPEKMPGQLIELNTTLSGYLAYSKVSPEQESEEKYYKQILLLLKIRIGVDFTYYKQTTIRRRILRRMALMKIQKINEYESYLKENKPELDILFQDLLIPVTSFFRDAKTFEILCANIFPELVKNKSAGNPLRIWIAGCSTGEEAYSMAMCMHEYLSDKISTIKIQIFATDISDKSIAKARIGIYQTKELEGVSAVRLHQFFDNANGKYHVKKVVRDMCVFACHNFLKDPPFARIDLISCRNVLIYLEPFLQKKALSTFHYSLKPKGYLVLGKSETTGNSSELFLPFSNKEKIFTRKSGVGKFINVTSERNEESIKDNDYGIRSNERKKDDYQRDADDILLSKYMPAGVIVDEQLDVVQFRGSTSEFLEQKTGKATLNVLKMAKEGLSFELRNALYKSRKTNEVFIKEAVPLTQNGKLVTIEVIPLNKGIEPHFLILFKETIINQLFNPKVRTSGKKQVDDEKDNRIQKLEKELAQARDDMRSISENQEAVNEELQSTNEELLSGSEELQSLNEEMETGREELQSTNEELITVNQELFDRNNQLNRAKIYAETIVSTIHEPILVLDQDFRILIANRSFYKNFSITEEEVIDKILFDLQNKRWNIPGLLNHLLRIQTENKKFLEWETTFTFPIAGKRTICFNAQPIKEENSEKWVLLAFNDITIWKEKGEMEKKNADDLRKILDSLPQITFTANPDGSVTYFNQFFIDYSGLTFDESLDLGWIQAISADMGGEITECWKNAVVTGKDFNMEFLLKRKSDNLYRWHLSRASALRDEEGIITSWVGAATDIHDQKTKEQVKDEFISIASHELKTPLTTAKAYIQLLHQSLEKTGSSDLAYVQKANESINKLTNLVAELLDVSKIRNGMLNLNITTFPFDQMVKEAIDDVQSTVKTHHIIGTGDSPHNITADKERLQQVVINLLTNAVKYSPEADKIFVHTVWENGEVKVSIRDSGMGISRDNIKRIFEPYFREKDKAAHFQGLGIGLSICYEIIQRHDGAIWAESEPGQGSTFYFTLPERI